MFSTESSFITSKVIVTTTLFLSLSLVPARADDLTMMIEEHLASLGYDTGAVDGEADVKTAVAISQFQAEKGLEVTGVVSPQLAGILSAEVDKGSSSAAVGTASSSVAQQSSSTSQMNAEQQQTCLQEKIAAAQQAQPSKYGGDDVAKASAEIMEAGATANDLAEAARELGISESDIADCQPSAVQVAGGATAATAPQPAAQNVGYAEQGAFQAASYKLGQFDAMLQACTGARPAYRTEVESLVTAAHPDYRTEALSLYDSQYQSTNEALSAASSGTCADAQVTNIERQADITLESLRPKALPSATAVQSAAVSTGAATAGTGNAASGSTASSSPSVTVDSAALRTRFEHCEIMSLAIRGPSGFPTKAPPGDFRTNLGLKTCSTKCRGAFESSLERSRPAYPHLIERGISECHDIHRQAVAEYEKILSDFNEAFSNYAALRQQVENEFSSQGLTTVKHPSNTMFLRPQGLCEQWGGQDCDVFAKCAAAYAIASKAPPCGIFFYGRGNDGNETKWEEARDGLIVRGETINFDKMSAVLPAEMSRAIVAEGAAYEAECDRRESNKQNKLKNCACYKDIYLDERMKTQRFGLLFGDFDQNLMRDKTWARCINEEGYRDYLMRNCMGPVSGQGPAKEAAQKPYCECQMEPMLDEIKVQTEYANGIDWTKVTKKAFQACRALRPEGM
jgi:peptidoglycan hydrolase-like protein with peptidoglycan-binding domain